MLLILADHHMRSSVPHEKFSSDWGWLLHFIIFDIIIEGKVCFYFLISIEVFCVNYLTLSLYLHTWQDIKYQERNPELWGSVKENYFPILAITHQKRSLVMATNTTSSLSLVDDKRQLKLCSDFENWNLFITT